MLPESIFGIASLAVIFFTFPMKSPPSEAMGSFTLRDLILHFGPRPEAQTFVKGDEEI